MWIDDEGTGRRRSNRRKYYGRGPLLMVNARLEEQRQERMHRVGAVVLMTVVVAGAIWLLLLGSRVAGAYLFSENDQFMIRNFDLSSTGKLQPGHILEYGKIGEGMNLFAVDIRKVRQELESVPVVASVEVRRKLPDTLVVRIKERIAIARLGQDDGGFHLAVDRDGYVLGPSSLTPGLPSILGVREKGLRPGSRLTDPAVMDALIALDTADEAYLSSVIRIKSVNVGPPELLDVRLADGARVLLSRGDIPLKLERLKQILLSSSQRGLSVASVDMTVDRNFPVQYR